MLCLTFFSTREILLNKQRNHDDICKYERKENLNSACIMMFLYFPEHRNIFCFRLKRIETFYYMFLSETLIKALAQDDNYVFFLFCSCLKNILTLLVCLYTFKIYFSFQKKLLSFWLLLPLTKQIMLKHNDFVNTTFVCSIFIASESSLKRLINFQNIYSLINTCFSFL